MLISLTSIYSSTITASLKTRRLTTITDWSGRES